MRLRAGVRVGSAGKIVRFLCGENCAGKFVRENLCGFMPTDRKPTDRPKTVYVK
jgi:hypothetical protein